MQWYKWLSPLALAAIPLPASAWEMSRHGTACVADSGDGPYGAGVMFVQTPNDKGTFAVLIYNQSWSIEEKRVRELTLKYHNLKGAAYIKDLPPIEELMENFSVDAMEVEFIKPSLMMLFDKEFLDYWTSNSERGLRISFVYNEKDLTGITPVPPAVKLHLDKCISPF